MHPLFFRRKSNTRRTATTTKSAAALLALSHLLGTEWKGFLDELIKSGLDKVRNFVEAENPV